MSNQEQKKIEEKRKKFASRFSNRRGRRGKRKPSKKEQKIEKFWKNFKSSVDSIKTSLGEDEIDFEEINKKQTELMSFFSRNMYYLKPYDKRQGSKIIKELEEEISLASEKRKGEGLFSFEGETKEEDQLQLASTEEDVMKQDGEDEENPEEKFDLTISGIENSEKVVKNLTKDDYFLISNCSNSSLKLECVSGTGYLKNLKNCEVNIGPISRSIFLQNCEGCMIVVACRQFRARNCQKCDFYVHVNSTPVIEKSSSIRVSKYKYALYEGAKEHFVTSELDRDKNFWDQIQDFNWQRKEKSPNWTIIPKDDTTI